MTKSVRKYVKITKEIKDLVLSRMSEGYDIQATCKEFPGMPHPDSIYRLGVTDKEFGEQLNMAYTILLMRRMDDFIRQSSLPAREVYPQLEDWREAEATLKRKLHGDEFILDKMGPLLSRRFQKTDKLEVSSDGSLATKVCIINYADAPD